MEYRQYITSTNEEQRAAFLNGARAMMTALSYHDADGIRRALCQKNDQHIIALLAGSEKLETAQRRQDAINLLDICHVDWDQFHAFVFDRSGIDPNGFATDGDSHRHTENQYFELFRPNKERNYWPHYRISTYDDDGKRSSIDRVTYRKLGAIDKTDYDYVRFLNLTCNGKSFYALKSNDKYFVEEIIKRDILLDNPGINRRYLISIGISMDPNKDNGPLYAYKDVIVSTLRDLSKNPMSRTFIPETVLVQAEQGYIRSVNHLVLAQCQAILHCAKPSRLWRMDSYDIQQINRLIKACKEHNSNKVLSDEDISEYRNINGQYLSDIAQAQISKLRDSNGDLMQPAAWAEDVLIRVYLTSEFVDRLSRKLIALLSHDLTVADFSNIDASTAETLKALSTTLCHTNQIHDDSEITKHVQNQLAASKTTNINTNVEEAFVQLIKTLKTEANRNNG